MDQKKRLKLLLQLFGTMFYISSFTFGGGFVIVTFMKRKFVDEYGWLTEQEMLDYTALAQSSPGAIAVNAAVLVGWRMAGFAGMLAAALGTILPPMLVICGISLIYQAFSQNRYVAMALSGMQAGVAAVIIDVVLNLGGKVLRERNTLRILLMVCAFIAAFFLDVSVILIILAAGVIGACAQVVSGRKGDGR
ncbi:MAG: chromate transporter [Clostridia bacterium]|nr:chromate transporter [Clostridia bacterium]